MKWPIFAFAVFLFALAVLPSVPQQSILAWQASLLSSEFGQWLALVCLSLMFLLWLGQAFSTLDRFIVMTVLAAASALFLSPTLQMQKGLPGWKADLNQAFGEVLEAGLSNPSPTRIFSGALRRSQVSSQVYTYDQTRNLALDFYRAVGTAKAPWVLVIHGGGWDSGERTQLSELNSVLAKRGIAVASISYRLAPEAKWPAPKEDALSAVQFMKEHAQELGIDPTRWVVLGRSAGGQIAEALAFSSSDSTLKGCISFYAPADLNFAYEFGREDDVLRSPALLREYIGGNPKEKAEAFNDASAIRFAGKTSVPTLLLHGARDSLVWTKQSERLISKLHDNGVASALIMLPWATHGFDYSLNGPGGQVSTYAVEYFLEKVFK
jgi:acetyl esterase/lipase